MTDYDQRAFLYEWKSLSQGGTVKKPKAPKPETKDQKLARLEKTVRDIETITGFNRNDYITMIYMTNTSIVDEVRSWVARANRAEAKNEELGKILERFVPPAKDDES